MTTSVNNVSKEQLREMMKAACHFGHQVHKWNPKMRPFIYTKRNGIHIFDLTKTVPLLQRALTFLRDTASQGKTILFVSTKLQAIPFIEELSQKTGSPYVTNRWVAGMLTNFSTIKKRIKYLGDLQKEEETGEFDKYTKKEALQLKRKIVKLKDALGGVQGMHKLPDAIFVLDAVRDNLAVKEAKRVKIPIVALVDSNADPDDIDYPIPGNDDAVKSIRFFLGAVEKAVLDGKMNPKQPVVGKKPEPAGKPEKVEKPAEVEKAEKPADEAK